MGFAWQALAYAEPLEQATARHARAWKVHGSSCSRPYKAAFSALSIVAVLDMANNLAVAWALLSCKLSISMEVCHSSGYIYTTG
jgi:hypothetical protein